MSVAIRQMTAADVGMGDSLRALAGWNQTPADWRRILSLEPGGCFVAEWDGLPVGTTTTTCYGTELAWIGMVLVHPDFRGRGIGRALMDHCVEYLKRRGLRSIMLDATPLGERLYSKLGFSVASRLARWERAAMGERPPAKYPGACEIKSEMWPEIVRMDASVFGVPRERLLDELRRDSLATLHPASKFAPRGFGMIRPGVAADYLGPVEVDDSEFAERLVCTLLEQTGRRVFWDIPEENRAAIELAEHFGFRRQRPLARMVCGHSPPAGIPDRQYAIADPACG